MSGNAIKNLQIPLQFTLEVVLELLKRFGGRFCSLAVNESFRLSSTFPALMRPRNILVKYAF